MAQHIHLIAICGTAMGTLAGMLKAKGFHVTGSDENVYPPMSDMLAQWKIPILPGFRPENLNPPPDLVVVGNAVSKTNPEVMTLLDSEIPYLSLPQALAEFFLKDKTSIVVAGTHGKTTTTSLAAWLFHEAGVDPSFLVGGIPQNFGASFRLGKGDYFVIEGDEYDTAFFDKGPKFWHYRPFHAIVTGVEFDHADIYRDLEHLTGSFKHFVELIPPEGTLFLNGDQENALALKKHARSTVITYGLNPSCDVYAKDPRFDAEGVEFEWMEKGESQGRLRSPLPGRHNLQNLMGVFALSSRLNLDREKVKKGILSFQGIKRRQEVRGEARGVTVIDDFAHHPTAVKETLDAMRFRYPGRKIWALFEPRSNTSRRAVFQKDFGEALSVADEVVIAKVFKPEKVKDAPLLDEKALAEDIARRGKPVAHDLTADAIVDHVVARVSPGDVLLVMSNGGFDDIHQKLLDRLKR